MTLDSTLTREGLRSDFGTALEGNLVGADLPGQVFYAYKKAKLEGQSPVTMLLSSGMAPAEPMPRVSFQARNMIWRYEVWNFVLWGSDDGTYDEASAEDTIDQMALIVLDTIESFSTGNKSAKLEGPTVIRSVKLEGFTYLWEAFPVTFQINA